MTKKQFREQTVKLKAHLEATFTKEVGMAFVVLLEASDKKENTTYNDILSNVRIDQVQKFANTILTIARSIMGRNN